MGSQLNWNEYATTWAGWHGGFDPRLAAPGVRRWVRGSYLVGSFLGRLRVPPTAVTVLGLLSSVAVPVTAVRLPWGPLGAAGFVLLAAVADSVDGAVAVSCARTTRLGYVYDSLADRLGEALWLVAFWLIGASGPLVTTCGALTWAHEYVRARAVSAGMKQVASVTIGEQPTRASIAVVGLWVAGLAGLVEGELRAGTITVAAAVWALLTIFGLAQLLTAMRRALR